MIRSSQSPDRRTNPPRPATLGQYPNGVPHAYTNIQGVDELTNAFDKSVSIANPTRVGPHITTPGNIYPNHQGHSSTSYGLPRPLPNINRVTFDPTPPGAHSDSTFLYPGTENYATNYFAPYTSSTNASLHVEEETVDWEEFKENMDIIFEKQAADKTKDLPVLPRSPLFLDSTKLEPHQNEGVRWLADVERHPRQNPNSASKLLKDGCSMLCYDLLYSKQIPTLYHPVRGSVLGDEMGLGKTLEALTLIVTNPPHSGLSPRCTLVVCPNESVVQTWLDELEKHFKKNALCVEKYSGDRKKRSKIINRVQNQELDILFATYGVVNREFENPDYGKDGQFLPSIHDVFLFRIILDEAHHIRNPSTKTFKSIMSVTRKTSYRLALTGTPLMNSVNDVYSLLAFVGLEPLANRQAFDELIGKPILNRKRTGLEMLRNSFAHVVLRRTKNILPNLDLFGKAVSVCKVPFAKDQHKEIHYSIYKVVRAAFDGLINGGGNDGKDSISIIKAERAMLTITNRVLSSCNSGELVSTEHRRRAEKVMSELRDGRSLRKLTAQDAAKVIEQLQIGQDDIGSDTQLGEEMPMAPKITHLLQVIQQMATDEKAVIFSQYPSFLNLIEKALVKAGHSTGRIDGGVPNGERVSTVQSFNLLNGGSRFILCSLKAAGEGLNLTRGNVVFMMDPYWNSAQEQQAVDRCHRLGQVRPVRVYQMVMKGSIEERMLKIQKSKQMLSKGIFAPLNLREEKVATTKDRLKELYLLNSSDDGSSDRGWD